MFQTDLDGDDMECTWCHGAIDPASEFAEFGQCAVCEHMFADTFIRAFNLVEGVHYERGADGAVAHWLGDIPMAAAAVWYTVHYRERDAGRLEQMTPALLVAQTRQFLEYCHGHLPAPFADPDAWHQRLCPACVETVDRWATSLHTPCLLCGQRLAQGAGRTAICLLGLCPPLRDTSGAPAAVVVCLHRGCCAVVYRLCDGCAQEVQEEDLSVAERLDARIHALLGPLMGGSN